MLTRLAVWMGFFALLAPAPFDAFAHEEETTVLQENKARTLEDAQGLFTEIKANQDKAQQYAEELAVLQMEHAGAAEERQQEILSQAQLKQRSLQRLNGLIQEKQAELFDLASTLLLSSPDSVELRMMRCEASFNQGAFDLAIEDIGRLPEEELTLDHRMILAQSQERLGRYAEAVGSYRKAMDVMAEDQKPYVLDRLAYCNFNAMEFAKAEELYKSLAELAPEPQKPRFQEGAKSAAQYAKLWERELALREAEAQADDNPQAVLETDKGTIKLELFENQAPNTVANFVTLVESNFYDGLLFHRVIPQFVIQAGCPEGTGQGGPGYEFADECRKAEARDHFIGSLSMANSGPNTNGSQFFITTVVTGHLNGRHTVFGRVLEGQDVANRIAQGDKILSARVLRKRDHDYQVDKL